MLRTERGISKVGEIANQKSMAKLVKLKAGWTESTELVGEEDADEVGGDDVRNDVFSHGCGLNSCFAGKKFKTNSTK